MTMHETESTRVAIGRQLAAEHAATAERERLEVLLISSESKARIDAMQAKRLVAEGKS